MSQPQAESPALVARLHSYPHGRPVDLGLAETTKSPIVSQELGPGAFVLIVGAALVLLGLILLWQIARGERFEPEDTEDALADAPVSYPALASVGLAVFLPALIMPYLGFPITGMISFMLIAWALGSKRCP